MKLLTATIAAASVLFGFAAAEAGEPVKDWTPHQFTTAPINSTDRINAALAAQGQPPLNSARVLQDDSGGKPAESHSTITYRYR